MWVAFAVGSRPCSRRFYSGYSVFSSPQKPKFPNSTDLDLDYIIVKHSIMSLIGSGDCLSTPCVSTPCRALLSTGVIQEVWKF